MSAILSSVTLPSTDRDEDHVAPLVHAAPEGRYAALKNALHRKRQRPAVLTPLDSPQHTHRLYHDDDDAAITTVEPWRSPLRRPASPTSLLNPLPPLVATILERKRLFLNPQGEPVVGIEEILQLQEAPHSPLKLRASPLQLIAVPRKVFDDDEVALMPCHSLHYRHGPLLAVEKWKEPIRDRNKHWRDDELTMILATPGCASRDKALAETKMTRGPGNVRKGTWRRLDSQRLQIKSSTSTSLMVGGVTAVNASPGSSAVSSSTGTLASPAPSDIAQPGEVLLRVQGAMISMTYSVVKIYGVGIYGRLYSEGLADRDGQNRFLRIDAYDPQASQTASLRVSLSDLAWVFEAHPDLLAAGRKQKVLSKVVSLLYFQYPGENEANDRKTLIEDETLVLSSIPKAPPVLCISPDEKLNEAARRRRERNERVRREEQERLRLLALLNQMPRRARHRLVFQLRRVSGHAFLISIYHFPTQIRNFLIVGYHTQTSRTLTLTVGVLEAAALNRVFSPPHKWTRAQTAQIAAALVSRLFLRAIKPTCVRDTTGDGEARPYRMALAITEDRGGVPGAWLALPAPYANTRKDEVVAKYKKDGQQEFQLLREQQLTTVELEATTKSDQLRGEIAQAEAILLGLQQKDVELKDKIEEINSSKGLTVEDEAQKPQHHDQRRGHKAARKTLKEETKVLQARLQAWKRELDRIREHAILASEKVQSTYDKALETLTQEAVTATLSLWFDPLSDRKMPLQQSQEGGNAQRRKLHRAEIRDDSVNLASGACRLYGHCYRFSIFAEVPSEIRMGIEWFQLSFYDAMTSRTWSLRLHRLEWLAMTKSQHDACQAIAALGLATSPSVTRIADLDTQYEVLRRSLGQLKPLKKNNKKRKQLLDGLEKNRLERRLLWRDQAPWDPVVRALCDRLQVTEQEELVLDRCLYRATLGIVAVGSDGEGDVDGDGVVECDVWVTQELNVVSFYARDVGTQDEWMLEYPDSVELVKEFAVETALELQLHLEAIAMTLLLYSDEEISLSGEKQEKKRVRNMRFEE